MNDCNSPYIVGYYGCFPADVHVGVVMECMDAGSLNDIYRRNGAIPIQIVGKVAEAVLRGLIYLYDVHRIIHRGRSLSLILVAGLWGSMREEDGLRGSGTDREAVREGWSGWRGG